MSLVSPPAQPGYQLVESAWLFSSFSALHRIAFDAGLFLQRYAGPLDEDTFARAADEAGLVAEHRRCRLDAALAWRLPVAVQVRSSTCHVADARASEEGHAPSHWALVITAGETSVAVLEAEASTPVSMPIAELRQRYEGNALSLAPRVAASADPDDLQFRTTRFSLRWFAEPLLKHRGTWRDVLLASLVLQLMALATPLFTQVIIDKVIVHRTSSTLISLGFGMLMFLVFTAVFTWVRQQLVLHTGRRIDAVLGSHVFDHLLKLPPSYFQHRPTGIIAARMQGIETIREFLSSAAITLALDLPFLVIFLAIMFWYSVPLTLLALALIVLISILSIVVAPQFRERLNEQFRRGAANQAFVTEYVAAMDTVKALQLEPQLNHRYRNLLSEQLSANLATGRLANTYNTLASALEQAMTVVILVWGAWIVMTTTALTVGMLVAFQMFSARITQPILRMVGLWQQWQQTRMSIARLGDIMNAPTESYSLKPRRSASAGAGRIEVEGLSFRYSEQLPLLFEEFNLCVKPGELIALMGASGAGKSTLARLLLGFQAPTGGRIRLDGVDHNHLSANELRSIFGVVPQDTILFSGTILENLTLANPFASMEQVVASCRMAEIHTFIEEMPLGYQSMLGERGVGLSGGQRQRLSIARALLKGPKVLIFDEATSSVDLATAEQLGKTISALKGRVSILFIAHALPRSLQADHIVRIGGHRMGGSEEKAEAAVQ